MAASAPHRSRPLSVVEKRTSPTRNGGRHPPLLAVANECASDERVRNAETPAEELNQLTCKRSRRRFTLSAWAARPVGGCAVHHSIDGIRPRLVRRVALVTALGVNCLLAIMGLSILTGVGGRTNGAVLLIDGAVAGGLSAWSRSRSSRASHGGHSDGHIHQTVMSRLCDLDTSVDADSLLVAAARVLGETRCLPYVRIDMFDADGAPAGHAQYGSPGFGATPVVIDAGQRKLACRLEISRGPVAEARKRHR